MSLTPTSRPSWICSFFRPLVVVFLVVLVVAWSCTLAFYVRPAWLSGITSYGFYWRYLMHPIVQYLMPCLSVGIIVIWLAGWPLRRQPNERIGILALACAIAALITAIAIPILEPMW